MRRINYPATLILYSVIVLLPGFLYSIWSIGIGSANPSVLNILFMLLISQVPYCIVSFLILFITKIRNLDDFASRQNLALILGCSAGISTVGLSALVFYFEYRQAIDHYILPNSANGAAQWIGVWLGGYTLGIAILSFGYLIFTRKMT